MKGPAVLRRLGSSFPAFTVVFTVLAAPASADAPPSKVVGPPQVPAAQAIAFLNQQRAANGIPSVVEDPAMSDACAKHIAYMEVFRSGDLGDNPHAEDPAQPGYTPEGNTAAASSALRTGREVEGNSALAYTA